MKPRSSLSWVVLAALVAACGGTETGNPGGARVSFGIRASDTDIVSVGPGGTGDRVEALLLVVDEAALVGCAPDPSSTPLLQPGTVVDLVQGARSAAVPAGEYCGVRVTLVSAQLPGRGDAPPVSGATVAAHGVRADGVPFTVVSRTPLTIDAGGEPFQLRDGDALIFAFDASRWLGGGILERAAIVDGRATIDGTGSGAAEFDAQTTAALFRDSNGDNVVDDGETVPLAATDSVEVSTVTRSSGGPMAPFVSTEGKENDQ